MALYRWRGPDGWFAVVDGAPRRLAAGDVVDLPAGSSPELWEVVKGKRRGGGKPAGQTDTGEVDA